MWKRLEGSALGVERPQTSGRLDLGTGKWFNPDMSKQKCVYRLKMDQRLKSLIFSTIGSGLRVRWHRRSSIAGSVEN
jgi:hypothetical protein